MIKRKSDYTVKSQSARSIKSRVRQLLVDYRIDEIVDYFNDEPRVRRALMSLLFDSDPKICMRSVFTLGRVSGREAESDADAARETIRKILWQMGEESGGLCWYGSEAIGEILINVPELVNDFWNILVVYTKEEPFERGSYRALYRLSGEYGKLGDDHTTAFVSGLEEHDPAIRIYSLLGLSLIGADEITIADSLVEDKSETEIFENETGEFEKRTVGTVASDVLESFSGP